MQTFLPVPDFWGSATLLDRQRLGKQRVENYQIMQALTGLTWSPEPTGVNVEGAGFDVVPYDPPASVAKHWVTAMWRGHELELWLYQAAVCDEWTSRGYRDTCRDKTYWLARVAGVLSHPVRRDPEWFGDDEFHAQHRARLVAKDPAFYGPLFPGTDPIDDYDFRWRRDT